MLLISRNFAATFPAKDHHQHSRIHGILLAVFRKHLLLFHWQQANWWLCVSVAFQICAVQMSLLIVI